MRKVTRNAAPTLWTVNEPIWNAQWVDLTTRNPKASFQWYTLNKASCRELLLPVFRLMHAYHCAFCDGFPLDALSRETVEHFRPKCVGGFPQFAFSWTNLYYCCDRCQSAKLEHWDEKLLAPDAIDYEFQRFFEYDFSTGALRPNATASADDAARAQATIDTYKLDIPTLRRWRSLELQKWVKLKGSVDIDQCAYRDFLSSL